MNDFPILIDPHIHTLASGHGTSDTITDIAKAACARGLSLIGITEHGPSMANACRTSYFRSLSLAPQRRFGVQILYGCEVNILDDCGHLDLERNILEALDLNIASLHTKCLKPGDRNYNTKAYIEVMKQPYIHIIGHCDDVAFPVDYKSLVKEAVNTHTLLELNNASLSPNGYRGNVTDNIQTLLNLCAYFGHPIVLSSDSHGKKDVGNMGYAIGTLEAAKFPKELVLNRTPDDFLNYMNSKHH